MTSGKINIQREIEEILAKEFEAMIEGNADNPLFKLLRSKKLEDIPIEEIRKEVVGE